MIFIEYNKNIINKYFNKLLQHNNNNNNRDAISSIKGYDYQFFYFMNMILSNIDNDNVSFIYEGNEDIDLYIDDKLNSLIQVKYHNTENNINDNEILTIKGGLFKVFLYFRKNYEKLKNISKIIYSITNEPGCILKTSPKNYKNYILNNDNNIYDILKERKEYTKNDFKLNHFCTLLSFEFIQNKTINNLIDDILIKIENTFLYTKLNNSIKIDYKKEYILSLLDKYIRNIIYNNTKSQLKINKLKTNINNDINNNYTEEQLIDEIINMLNLNKSIILPILTERIVNLCINNNNLIIEYKLLKLNINDISLLEKLKNDIYDKSIALYNTLINDRLIILSIQEKKKIGHNIANILNVKKYTITMNSILQKYYTKKYINNIQII
jgi:hypothetical protein